MMSDIYNGTSEGFSTIVDGYVDYAMEVITGRAIPDLRDGLKVVTRRILYATFMSDENRLRKFQTLVGAVMSLHPHGDSSIYEAMVLLTDENGTCQIPYFQAMGNLGKVYLSDKAAAPRYTKGKLNDNKADFFLDKEMLNDFLVPAEEGEGVEPSVLPARYPVVLVNGAEGIAVSAGTKLASFNVLDVLGLVQKYIRNGKLTLDDMIFPDFSTGGVLVQDESEVAKVMLTGKGKLKVRAKVEVKGKEILVKEIPYGKTVNNILTAIDKLQKSDYKAISNAYSRTGINSDCLISITVNTRWASVEDVILELYRRNILQDTFASNMLVIDNGKPKILGVYGIIEDWVNWRRGVVEKKFNIQLEAVRKKMKEIAPIIDLMSNADWRDEYVRRLVHEDKASCDSYARSIIPGIPDESLKWLRDRRAVDFNKNHGKYQKDYNSLCETEKNILNTLQDIDGYIYNEMSSIASEKRSMGYGVRKTELSTKAYKFSKISVEPEKDTAYCVYTLKKDGFLTKTRSKLEPSEDILCEIEANASSILIGFDNRGRVLRVLGEEIPYTGNDNGVYLPKPEIFNGSFDKDYKILYLCLLDGSKKVLLYRDGYVGFFDTSEFMGKRNTRIIDRGVCLAVMDKLLDVYNEEDVPELMLCGGQVGDRIYLGIASLKLAKEKSRTSRTKILDGADIDYFCTKGFNNIIEIAHFMSDVNFYMGKFRWFRGDFYGDPAELVDGRYLEICKDFNN